MSYLHRYKLFKLVCGNKTNKCYNVKVALSNFHVVNVALGGKKVGDPWSSMYCILAYTAASRHMLIVNLAGIVSLACVLAYYC